MPVQGVPVPGVIADEAHWSQWDGVGLGWKGFCFQSRGNAGFPWAVIEVDGLEPMFAGQT